MRVGLTLALATASFYLVEKPLRRARLTGWKKVALAPAAAVATAAAVVIATLPAVAAPTDRAHTAAVVPGAGGTVPGAGGYGDQVAITLPTARAVSPADPLRVLLLGDSVMYVNAPGITASLEATGEATVTDRAIVGFGLSTAKNWPTSFPSFVADVHPDVVLATWSWDDAWALEHPVRYLATLESAMRVLLTPGNGVSGVIFTQFPPSGPFFSSMPNAAADTAYRQREQAAWDRVVRKLPAVFPGRVMYLPVASSILLAGKYFTQWLPPAGRPHAPTSQWVRIRMIDRVHLCPPGVVRYSTAVLADMTSIFHLAPAEGPWYGGSWTNDARYNDPPGSCPDDHPPG